jgi:hypothetical protein
LLLWQLLLVRKSECALTPKAVLLDRTEAAFENVDITVLRLLTPLLGLAGFTRACVVEKNSRQHTIMVNTRAGTGERRRIVDDFIWHKQRRKGLNKRRQQQVFRCNR